jgi:ELWxxDGT repeat protein
MAPVLSATDGTTDGTNELTPIAGTDSPGLFSDYGSPDLTVFVSEVLCAGENTGDQIGLWTADGTAAGAKEITDINGAASTGVTPSELTVFGSVALFNGDDAAGDHGLWTTDGTVAETRELTGIVGAASTGINPGDMTVSGSELLFFARDRVGQRGLWVTDACGSRTARLPAPTN